MLKADDNSAYQMMWEWVIELELSTYTWGNLGLTFFIGPEWGAITSFSGLLVNYLIFRKCIKNRSIYIRKDALSWNLVKTCRKWCLTHNANSFFSELISFLKIFYCCSNDYSLCLSIRIVFCKKSNELMNTERNCSSFRLGIIPYRYWPIINFVRLKWLLTCSGMKGFFLEEQYSLGIVQNLRPGWFLF